MKILKIESTFKTFRTIPFDDHFTVIAGDSKKNKKSRSHNLGKSTIIGIIDFVLFNGSGRLLTKIKKIDKDCIFKLSLKTENGSTIYQRGFSRRKPGEAKSINTTVSYEFFIRKQGEFTEEFRKPTYLGKDYTWKPLIFGLLGFDQNLLDQKLRLSSEIDDYDKLIKIHKKTSISDQNKNQYLESLIKEKDQLNLNLNKIDLLKSDLNDIKKIVTDLDKKIGILKNEIYFHSKEKQRIEDSLHRSKSLITNTIDIAKIFEEINIYFGNEIKKDISEIKEFQSKLIINRTKVLNELLKNCTNIINEKNKEIENLNSHRNLSFKNLLEDESEKKYKDIFSKILLIEKEISSIEQSTTKMSIQELESTRALLVTEHLALSAKLSKTIDDINNTFNSINSIYKKIMKDTMNINAEIKIIKNSTGNVEFRTKSYKNNKETQELEGSTAKKISCAAVDLAIRSFYKEDSGFIIHDGIIDDIDKNAATEYIKVVKKLSIQYNFQYILLAIKDKLPSNINASDIKIELNDYTPAGLLFGRKY
ncbi:DUF2326 domain-containing protein [Leptospira sp. 201903074]|uniref:DUF2326 domain-containing protein n=1 Tax=Leptospira abararensis TaxID=2810036 RepID=UPI001965482F|nr:DUF2326 domain-containing protein [Leptospira abararensis]MBM9547452.1 DUF2326 domain-containing protein [Leptospira abararensis]